MKKRAAILTSGGDAPGMNAAIRAFMREGISCGYEIFSVELGYEGLVSGKIKLLSSRDVGLIINQGGTFIKTARSKRFMTEKGILRAAENLKKRDIGALCVIGGEGSFKGMLELSKYYNGQLVGIPGTIDNDIEGTDYSIGFNTAVETAVNAVDKIRDTAMSHGRIFFIEVMGRKSGNLAKAVAIACGAEDALIPEVKTNVDELCSRIINNHKKGKRFSIIVVAEGDDAGGAFKLAETVREKTGLPHRVTILGHIQRGGAPSAYDRIMATKMGVKAFEFIKNGMNLVFTASQKGELLPEHLNNVHKSEISDIKKEIEQIRILAG
ncbi:MAG: 6-phosphofructokinase [Spirochaetia bacterium]|nr:6-phosphofructokinase [Spirochaetia bacterium]